MPPKAVNVQSKDPRDEKSVLPYAPIAIDDSTYAAFSVFSMILSVAGMMLQMKYLSWMGLYCSVIHLANRKPGSMQSTITMCLVLLVMTYANGARAAQQSA
eukprot:m.25447 g.25447  ORF g.25447 m.25447 type:complete len:101 (-) comp4160_c1_seq1:33-335(-)